MIINKDEIREKYTKLIDLKCNGSIPLFISIVGSQSYKTNTPDSDFDFAGVFMQSQDDIYGLNYIEQIEEKKEKGDFGNKKKHDAVFYEVKRFLQLLQTANPSMLSILFSPEDCIIYKHPYFDIILKEKKKFLTKMCKNSFAGYAVSQIKKAKGLDKMQNWEKNKITRKEPIDFCYVIEGYKTINLKKYLKDNNLKQECCGLTKTANARDVYALFYDSSGGEKKYKGITKTGLGESKSESNQLRLSSIQKGEKQICIISYNKDAYTTHCRDYKNYKTWIENRNESRYVDNKKHNQKIDSKNIMHLVRLLKMAREISESGNFIVSRPDAEYLKSIKRGDVNILEIIDWAEKEILIIDELFLKSDLPKDVDKEFVNKLLIEIRRNVYK